MQLQLFEVEPQYTFTAEEAHSGFNYTGWSPMKISIRNSIGIIMHEVWNREHGFGNTYDDLYNTSTDNLIKLYNGLTDQFNSIQ